MMGMFVGTYEKGYYVDVNTDIRDNRTGKDYWRVNVMKVRPNGTSAGLPRRSYYVLADRDSVCPEPQYFIDLFKNHPEVRDCEKLAFEEVRTFKMSIIKE